jgi:hypothetical protein
MMRDAVTIAAREGIMRRALIVSLVSFAALSLASCRPTATVGYPAVTTADLAGTRYQAQSSGGDKAAKFDWSFAAGRFDIRAGADPIPPGLQAAVLGAGKNAQAVEGAWKIEGNDLVLSDITADGKAVAASGRLHVWNHGVIRVSVPTDVNVQFAFSR